MSQPALHGHPTGVAGATTLRPLPTPRVPVHAPQAVLPLELPAGGLPARPELHLVQGTEDGLTGFAARLAQAVVEVMGGDRGVHQLMRWTTDEVYADLLRRTAALQRTTPAELRVRRVRAVVRSVRLFRPGPGAAELSVHVRHGERSRAIAARLERIEGRWRCTVLEFG